MSLRRRLFLGFVAVAAVLLVANLVLSKTIEAYLLDRLDQQLLTVARRPALGGGPARGQGRPPPDGKTLSEYFIAIGGRDATGFRQLGSALSDEATAPPRLDQQAVLTNLSRDRRRATPFTAPATRDGGSWRLVAVQQPRDAVTVVGLSLSPVSDTVGRIRLIQAAGTAAVLAALALASWWMLRLGVHPLENMARAADAIAEGDLSQRVDHPGEKTEAGRLGIALNSMLERIEEAFRAQQASEDRVRRFAADASHELRTPITSIRGYAELWRAGGLRGEGELAEAMRRTEQEASRMGRLVDDLLLLARLDQRRPLDRVPVRLDQLAADAVNDARAVEPGRPLNLVAEAVIVQGDETRLREVVANLVSNARVHTPATAPVLVEVTAVDRWARLVVADEGPGMAPDVAAKVFERFYRADPARARAGDGAGLGLSIVAAVVEAHGGTVTLTSEAGHGSRFVVDLPLAGSSHPIHSQLQGSGHTLERSPGERATLTRRS